jgi:hypothetical protein
VTDDGRIILSAWIPHGTMFEFTSAAVDAVRHALGLEALPRRSLRGGDDVAARRAEARRVFVSRDEDLKQTFAEHLK